MGKTIKKTKYKSYKPQHSIKNIKNLVSKILKNKVVSVKRLNYGEINAVYFVNLKNKERVVIRISPKEKTWNNFEPEAWAFQKCRKIGVPTPEVIALDIHPKDFPEPYMITRRISGKPGDEIKLSPKEKANIIKELGRYLFLIHSIKISGFGYLKDKGKAFVGSHDTLWDDINYELNSGWWTETVIKNNLLSKKDLEEIRILFKRHRNIFHLKKASLLHGDLSINNTLINKKKITGILDMENLKAGDPVSDFAWFRFWQKMNTYFNFNALKNGYNNKNLFDKNFSKKLDLYQLLIGCGLLSYFYTPDNKRGLNYTKQRITLIRNNLKI
jgi:aminoglycoside phosphotransferase (APT) family kinase protein